MAGVAKGENTGAMHPIEYVLATIGAIVAILGFMALIAMVRAH